MDKKLITNNRAIIDAPFYDENNIFGANQGGAKKGKKKYKLSKQEIKRASKELKQQMSDNNRIIKDQRRKLKDELDIARYTDYTNKTDHLVNALNCEREIISALNDNYKAAVRTNNTSVAKKISRTFLKGWTYMHLNWERQ